ncbi:MAG: DUF1858 domain-containing protein [Candidatus Cloacimonetes bacterium]|nr:DUF1858 domain-containing protein [Candidatus Cloacimonadota bacterium]MBS3768084.1 DUF1858 domain-containing protein [Candidatus Cloacimonadota bacterium]
MKVNKDIWIDELLDKYPQSQDFLSKKGIVCVMCGEPVWGTLEEQMEEKDFSEEEMDKTIKELNEFLEKNKGKKEDMSQTIEVTKLD